MLGHLHVTAALDSTGRTVLARQSFAAPIHVSKPHHDADWLVLNLASPTPGLFAGDRVDVAVNVEPGAKLVITAPSANRIHTMPEGHAELRQSFHVADGAALEVYPEYLIPQAGSNYRQFTEVRAEPGARLLWIESLAPGRAARGESFAFKEVRFSADLFHGVAHLSRERFVLRPENATLRAMRRVFPDCYYASIIAIGPGLSKEIDFSALHQLHDSKTLWMGATQLSTDAVAIRLLAADSPSLRTALESIRPALLAALKLPVASLRRTTGAPAESPSSEIVTKL